MEFWQQLVSTLFGAFAGAGAALFTGHLVSRREANAKEEAALNGLLLDLQLKRAFVAVQPSASPGAETSQDFKQCLESVKGTRTLIREARLHLRPNSKAFDSLATMSAACNTYLHFARTQPENYQHALMTLRSRLDAQAQDLGTLAHVDYREPGSYAYSMSRTQSRVN